MKVLVYWLVIKKDKELIIDEDKIKKIIDNYLKNEILKNRCVDYSGRLEFKSVDDIIFIMCLFISIVSILSYFCKEWKV